MDSNSERLKAIQKGKSRGIHLDFYLEIPMVILKLKD